MKKKIIENKINLLLIFLFFYFYYYPIISLNLKYRDDYIRSLILTFGFIQEGRIFSRAILNFFAFTDGILISPLTQILSITCISCTIIYVATTLFKKLNFFSFSITSLIFLNPFYLQNMSFGYDSLPMTISTCCAVISATFILKTRYYILFSAICALFILLSYQSALGIYVNCLLFILCKHYLEHGFNNQNQIYTKAAICLAIYALLSIMFTLIYPYIFSGFNTRFVINLSNIKINLLHTISYIKILFFNIRYIIYIAAITTLFSLIIFYFKQYKEKKITVKNILYSLITIPLFYIATLLAAEGPSIILNFEINNLRVLIGISLLWVLPFFIISLFSKYLYYIFYFIFSIFCFSTNYSYGIFLKDQDIFFQTLMSNINYDIGHTLHSSNIKIIALNAIPLSESNKRLTSKIPFFLYLYGEQDFEWLAAMKASNILPYYPSNNTTEMCQVTQDIKSDKKLTMKIIKSNDYTLYFDKNNVLIDFYTEKKNYYCNEITGAVSK